MLVRTHYLGLRVTMGGPFSGRSYGTRICSQLLFRIWGSESLMKLDDITAEASLCSCVLLKILQ